MNKNLKKFFTSKVSKRIVSGLTAFVLLFGAMPVGDIYDEFKDMDFVSISAGADEEHTTDDDPVFKHTSGTTVKINPSQLVKYSESCVRYHKYHQHDELIITAGSGDSTSNYFIQGFKGLGTETYPFAGTVKIDSNNSIVLNLDAPLFNHVYDNVKLNNNNQLLIARDYSSNETDGMSETHIDTTPLIASNVWPNEDNAQPAVWNIGVTQPSAGENPYLGDFGGFIGKMCQKGGISAKLTLNLTMNVTEQDTNARKIKGYNSNLGLICGTMEENTQLTVTLSASRKISLVESEISEGASGHVGGLVGQMDQGSVLNYTGNSILQDTGSIIKTNGENNYAGGIVGYNNGGRVNITLSSGTTAYPVKQTVKGTAGAGGVYGYYKPYTDENESENSDTSFALSKYSIDCVVNSTGYDGGLFGVLESENDYTISGSTTVKSNHNSETAIGYGGLIGRYNNSDLTKKLEIGAVTAEPTKGNATYYGGGIAVIGDYIENGEVSGGSCYVKFDSFTANAAGANSMTFGGLVSIADNAFVDAKDVTVNITNNTNRFKGGGVIGSLKSGVLRMSGTTDLSNTYAEEFGFKGGQIVGYRDNALIFGTDDWQLKRGTVSYNDNNNNPIYIKADDIGSWGEVLRFDGKDTSTEGQTSYGFGTDKTVVTVNETDHYATVAAPSYDDSSNISVGSVSDFAKAALNMQMNEGQSDGVLRFEESNTSSSLLGMNITLTGDVSLKGTGLTGFTRDNAEKDSISADKCVYTGMLDGDGHSITLAIGEPYGYRGKTQLTDHSSEGNGKIYHHKYNGLFGIVDTSSSNPDYVAKNLTIKGTADVYSYKNGNDVRDAYIGGIAGRAKGDFKVDNITMTDTVTDDKHETAFTAYGGGHTYVGGLLGQASTEIGDISITNSNVKCNIQTSNSNGDSCFGGLIGWIAYSDNESKDWNFTDVTVSGEINNTNARGTNKLGGIAAVITEYNGADSQRAVNLTNVTIDGLTLKANGSDDSSMGGALGYTWHNVNTTFQNVEVKNSTIEMSSGNGALAGLVYQGTGYWKVEPYSKGEQSTTIYRDGLKINGLTVTNSNAKSFGMIVNSAKTGNTALYLEILADNTTNNTKAYNIASANLNGLKNGCVFDEIAAYTFTDNVGKNGQAVISIHSDNFKTDGTSASGTYHAQTARGAVPNPNARYYYNLDTIKNATGSANLLMRWALHQYAHSSIRSNFTYGTDFSDSAIPDGTYEMKDYSWYPVDINDTVTVNGIFTFYNKEFEDSEQIKADAETNNNSYKRTSMYDSDKSSFTQHKFMHAGLFRDVTGTLNVGTITLSGNVGRFRNNSGVSESGALVCGWVKGSNANEMASLNITGGVTLDGLYVNGFNSTGTTDYAPLLVNYIREYTNTVIKGVKVKTSGYTDNFKAASSLIGDVGTTEATNITLTFKDMKLDGRDSGHSGQYSLDSVYGTKSAIFTRATFLNSFMYASGSSGSYDFNLADDWTDDSGTYSRASGQGVTYGSEISDYTNRNQYYGEEFWYKDKIGTIYTNYNQPTVSGKGVDPNGDPIKPAPVNFSGFLPYVYDVSTADSVATDKKYQIKVNHDVAKMTGCGTYNDPYIITSGDDLNNIAEILNGNAAGKKIALPNVNNGDTNTDFDKLKVKKWDDFGHTDFTCESDTFTNTDGITYNKLQVQTYLAGAYYKIKDGVNIELPEDFKGLGNTETTAAFFRGIIVGKGETITLKGSNPLIHTSYGSVVRDIQIVVDASVTVTGQKADFKEKGGCGAYGAVIGQALGGDNIIDQVSVGFRDNTTITVGGSNANLAAVGGYVGVITYGSLIFRNMSRDAGKASEIQGIPSDSTIVRFSSETNLISDTNMKWLYVNPIVGRVINAAVFTESTAYRPFEEGYREYVGDGGTTTRYNWPDGAVTMKNGTKNYSIADLKKPTAADMSDRIYVSEYSEATWSAFLTYKTTVDIPDAQSLFILSLLTQSKMTSTYYAHKDNKKSRYTNQAGEGGYAGYYNDNGPDKDTYDGINLLACKTTHLADYDHVGSSNDDAVADCAVAAQDTYTPATKQNPDSLVPYLVKNYTKPLDNASNGSYGVFSISNGGTVITNMKWSGTSGSTWYMPDGFKGLGCIFKLNNNLINDVTLSINKLEGNNHVIDLNMSLYHYDSDSEQYLPVSGNASGFGLFDAFRSNRFGRGQKNGNYDPNNKIKDFTITGSVTYHAYTNAGAEVNGYNKNVSGNANYSSVGAFVGRFDPAEGNNHRSCVLLLENVDLKQMKVEGVYRTGGLIGYAYNKMDNNDRQAYHHIYINDCSADNLNVSSVLYAGGLVGYSFKYAYDITNVTIEEPNIVLTLPFASKNDVNNAVGGLIGYIETETRNQQVCIKNVTVGKESPTGNYSAYIGYTEPTTTYPTNVNNEVIRAGGLIGRTNTLAATADAADYFRTKVEKCNLYNVSVYGHYTGGVIGTAENAGITIGVLDTTVQNTSDNTILGHRVNNGSRGTGGIAGNITAKSIVVNNCLVDGYTIKSTQRTGGIIGYTQATKTEIDNTEIKGISLISNSSVGGLVGYLDNPLNGYNIRTDNMRFICPNGASFTTADNKGANDNVRGHIVGYNSGKVIKIAGFSRNNFTKDYDTGTDRMIGRYKDTNTSRYGSGGYVIFADYEGKSQSSDKSIVASDVNSTANVAVNTYSIESASAQDNNFPYVTTSPKKDIANGQFLTGDAVSKLTYTGSIFKKILDENSKGKTGAYKNYGTVSEETARLIESKFSAANTEFTAVAKSNQNFPLLVVDNNDHETVTKMINSYIDVLTNTKYDFATDNSIYKVSLNKCVYDPDSGKFVIDADKSACLKRFMLGNQMYFRMLPSDVDNANATVAQFSLLDVQFFDPSTVNGTDTSAAKVAYHLYIPVYVKKLLQYRFSSSLLSNTEYYPSAYDGKNGNTVFENLGTPITMKFEYSYERTTDEWKNAINAGEDVLHNLNKVIDVVQHHQDSSVWPTNTKMVLVDANNTDKSYYLDTAPTGSEINLHDFVNGTEHFEPVALQDLMTVTIGQNGNGTLVKTTADDSKAIVRSGSDYYRLIEDAEKDEESVSYKPPLERYTVTSVSAPSSERYYLTIFTPKNDSDSTIYHYEMYSHSKLPKLDENDKGWRPNQVLNGYNTSVGLYTGNLYHTALGMTVNSKTSNLEMTSNNNYLDIVMTSTIKLNGSDAVKQGVASNMLNNKDTSSIYQMFLATYDMKTAEDAASLIGIQLKGKPQVTISEYKLYGGTSVVSEGGKDVSGRSWNITILS